MATNIPVFWGFFWPVLTIVFGVMSDVQFPPHVAYTIVCLSVIQMRRLQAEGILKRIPLEGFTVYFSS